MVKWPRVLNSPPSPRFTPAVSATPSSLLHVVTRTKASKNKLCWGSSAASAVNFLRVVYVKQRKRAFRGKFATRASLRAAEPVRSSKSSNSCLCCCCPQAGVTRLLFGRVVGLSVLLVYVLRQHPRIRRSFCAIAVPEEAEVGGGGRKLYGAMPPISSCVTLCFFQAEM